MPLSNISRLYPITIRTVFAAIFGLMLANASAAETDSSFIETIQSWNYSPRASLTTPLAVDTMPEHNHKIYPGISRSTFNESLGQMGQPGRPIALEQRKMEFKMPFIQPYSYYFFTHEDRIGYKTGQPFTDINYTTSSKKEQDIHLLITRNINPYFNVGLRLDYFSSEGHFINSQHRGSMISAFASYQGSVHRAFISMNFNNFSQGENGGMKYRSDMTKSFSDGFLEMEVNQTSAKSVNDYHDISIMQEWNLLPGFSFLDSVMGDTDRFKLLVGQEFLYTGSARRYKDVGKQKGSTPYYEYYYDSLKTFDVAETRTLSQEAFGGFNQRLTRFVSIGGRGGYGYEFENSRYNDIEFLDPETEFFSTYYTACFLGKIIGGYSWEVSNRQYVTGYRGGDMQIIAEASKTANLFGDTVLFEANFSNKSEAPHLFYQHYHSNNFIWDNNFGKTNSQNFYAEISDLRKRYSLSIYSALHHGYLYFGTDARPQQYNDALSELALSGSVTYSLRKFHFSHSLTWQNASESSVISAPAFVTEHTAYYSTYAFSGLLYLAVGFDVDVSSIYYAPSYMPATGIFYLQNEHESGMYPHTDVFMNFKLKRMRISAKYSQLGQIVDRISKDQIVQGRPSTVNGYFSGKPKFTLGLSWFFHK